MTSQPGATQPPNSEIGSVLCDKCKSPLLQHSDQTSSKFPIREKASQLLTEWNLSPRMWPVGYLIASSYSPLRVERVLPGRKWRDAFEDLLALESGGEMISPETRKEETAAAQEIEWQRASYCIGKLGEFNKVASNHYASMQRHYRTAKERKHHDLVSLLEKNMQVFREMVQYRVSLAQSWKASTEARREWSASELKARAQWIASLIHSGALTGWRSTMVDSADGVQWILVNRNNDPEEPEHVGITESELEKLFENDVPLKFGSPERLLYRVNHGRVNVKNQKDEDLDDGTTPFQSDSPVCMSPFPDRAYFKFQHTFAERITLPNGRLGNKVTLRNIFTGPKTEDKVVTCIQEPGKVLYEVQKARAAIHDRILGFNQAD